MALCFLGGYQKSKLLMNYEWRGGNQLKLDWPRHQHQLAVTEMEVLHKKAMSKLLSKIKIFQNVTFCFA